MRTLLPPPRADAAARAPAGAPDALLAEAGAALVRGDLEAARALCRRIVADLAASDAPAQLAGAVARLEARANLTGGDPDAALDALGAALAIATAAGDRAGAAHALNHTAGVHFARGELDLAQEHFEAARARARRIGHTGLVAATTLNLGAIANIHGDVGRAISAYQRAITHLRALGQEHDLARALNNLGMAKADLGEWAHAERAYRESLDIAARTGDVELQARLHGNIAESWVGRGDLAQAAAACDAAMRIAAANPDVNALGEAHKLAGIVARESGALDRADAAFAAAERVARGREDLLLLAETAREQADLYRRQSRNRDTLQALNRAHRLFERLRARRDLADVGRRMSRLEGDFVGVARRWGESIEAADRYTQGHCQRVADLSCLIAERAGLDAQALFWFRIGALLHDVGKLVIPAEVLNKPGKLSDEEFALMRSHTTEGVRMLADVEFPWDVRPIVESHHERWDGRGYPHGLAGEAIPLTARILCVADVYDALTSVRSYKRALSHDDALRLLRADAGTAFDPAVFALFEEVAPAWAARLASTHAAPEVDYARDLRAEREALGLDAVTGLPPRSAFFAEGARVLAARAGDERPTGLLLVRVLNGDAVIAARGRDAYDAALCAAGEALCRNTRGGDFVGRYADHEFVVLLPDVELREAHVAAARLRDAVESARSVAGGAPVRVHVGIGVSAAPQHGAVVDALLAAADASLGRVHDVRRAA